MQPLLNDLLTKGPLLVIITGSKRHGKDTLANHLGYTCLKLAEPLKIVCQNLFGFSQEQMETDLKEEVDAVWGITPRAAMQYLGTDVMQFHAPVHLFNDPFNRLFWVRHMITRINNVKGNIVISDCRFDHEVTSLRDAFGKSKTLVVVKVIRPDLQIVDTHVSESGVHDDLIDIVVENNCNNVSEWVIRLNRLHHLMV